MSGMVDRFGRTGFAALTSLVWAIPMAAWAGSSDLSPYDRTAYPGIALSIGVVMLVAWVIFLTWLAMVPVAKRQRRLDFGQMSGAEKRWSFVAAVFAVGLIAWLNAAATVDWSPLATAVGAGKLGPILFAIVIGAFLVAMVAGLSISWRRATAAFRVRKDSGS